MTDMVEYIVQMCICKTFFLTIADINFPVEVIESNNMKQEQHRLVKIYERLADQFPPPFSFRAIG